MEERTFGGEPGTGQDVTIILVPNGGSRDQKLALVHLHSGELSNHSKYFNTCLSERWKKMDSPSASMEFVLEVQTDVRHYFDCFSSMSSPSTKSFEGVEYAVELLKVASQIDFGELMERISLYLSCMLWSEEEEIRIQEYSVSSDFPRTHLVDLVARLGLDETEEDRQKQLFALVRQCTRTVLNASSLTPSVLTLPEFLQAIGSAPPSDYSRKVLSIVSQEAKTMFVNIDTDWSGKTPGKYNTSSIDTTIERIHAMRQILEALLKGQLSEELVQSIVHLVAIPKYISQISEGRSVLAKQKFAKVVLVMYKEVVAGRLLLRLPERMALLANWHDVLKKSFSEGSFEQAIADLFLTLPLKQQTELINLRNERGFDYISAGSLKSVLQFHRGIVQPGN